LRGALNPSLLSIKSNPNHTLENVSNIPTTKNENLVMLYAEACDVRIDYSVLSEQPAEMGSLLC
jgi:hypothetical protein